MTNDQKKSLAEWRANKKHNDEIADPNKEDDNKIVALESAVVALQATIAAMSSIDTKKNQTKPKPNPLQNPLSQCQVNFDDNDDE